jgi:hypothetical protein
MPENLRKLEIDRVIQSILTLKESPLIHEDPDAKEYIEEWNSTLNVRMQSAIVNEAAEFLLHKKQIKILENITYFALDAQIRHECRIAAKKSGRDQQELLAIFYPNYIRRLIGSDLDRFMEVTLGGMFTNVIGVLTSVRWVYQFELLEQKDKSIVNQHS